MHVSLVALDKLNAYLINTMLDTGYIANSLGVNCQHSSEIKETEKFDKSRRSGKGHLAIFLRKI